MLLLAVIWVAKTSPSDGNVCSTSSSLFQPDSRVSHKQF